MRTRLVVGAGLVALAAWGCGDDDGGTGRSASGEAGARAALVEFSEAFLDSKYDAACAVLTEGAKRRIARIKPCPEALKLTRGLIEADQLKSLRDRSRKVEITVDGDKATVDSITKDAKDKTNLVRQDGRWFVDADSE